MFSPLQLGVKYLKYLATAANGKGHGVHSPFVFNFITTVLNDSKEYEPYTKIEAIRKELLSNKTVLTIEDFGAGSGTIKSNERSIAQIARSSLKPKKFSQLLYRIIQYYRPQTIIELGTSLGVTTSYLASANANGYVYTFEGSEQVAAVAQQTFQKVGVSNIQIVNGSFDEKLEKKLQGITSVDLAFIDGNHRREPTLKYFEQLLKVSNEHSIFIFDDIHWSIEMEEAWKAIQLHPTVTLTIDLFFIGLVFFRKEQKEVQHFVIRFLKLRAIQIVKWKKRWL